MIGIGWVVCWTAGLSRGWKQQLGYLGIEVESCTIDHLALRHHGPKLTDPQPKPI